MSLSVFYLESAADAPVGSAVVLDGPEGHHAAAVRRVRNGELVTLTDGRGAAVEARVSEAGRRQVRLVVEQARLQDRPGPEVTVVQAVAKGDRGERAVELMTEVGVARIVPWQAERSVSRWGDKADRARARWQATADAAAKQSRRVWWPRVDELADLAGVISLAASAERAFVLHEAADESLVDLLADPAARPGGHVVVVVGPEGGITDDELAAMTASGARAARLGPTVLRTSTAGVVAATLVLATSPQWRGVPTSEGAARD